MQYFLVTVFFSTENSWHQYVLVLHSTKHLPHTSEAEASRDYNSSILLRSASSMLLGLLVAVMVTGDDVSACFTGDDIRRLFSFWSKSTWSWYDLSSMSCWLCCWVISDCNWPIDAFRMDTFLDSSSLCNSKLVALIANSVSCCCWLAISFSFSASCPVSARLALSYQTCAAWTRTAASCCNEEILWLASASADVIAASRACCWVCKLPKFCSADWYKKCESSNLVVRSRMVVCRLSICKQTFKEDNKSVSQSVSRGCIMGLYALWLFVSPQ